MFLLRKRTRAVITRLRHCFDTGVAYSRGSTQTVSRRFVACELVNLISCRSNDDACQRCKDIEEAIWQIGQSRYVEDSGLRHATGAPRDKYRRYGT